MLLLVLCLLLQPTVHYCYRNYTGYSVMRVFPSDKGHIQVLHDLHKNKTRTEDWHFEFWKQPTRPLQHVDIQMNKGTAVNAHNILSSVGVKHQIMIHDVQDLIHRQRVRRSAEVIPWTEEVRPITDAYHTFDEILVWLSEITQSCGEHCTLQNIGLSFENRPLILLKICKSESLPAVWIDGGLHAREWISPATVLYIIQKLVGGIQGSGEDAKHLVDNYCWYILPVSNPDGYVYTWTHDRMWRKTRSSNSDSPCKGVDPNRNWNFYWGGYGTSSNPCAENYRGAYPFSEPETRAMANFMWGIRDKLFLYLTFHSYGQYWLLPWGFSYIVPQDYSDLMSMGNAATHLLSKKYGAHYQIGTAARILYLASGGSDDWVKGRAGIKYCYTVELGDTGEHGFLLPPQHIKRTGESMFDALKMLLLSIEESGELRTMRAYM